MSTVRQICFVAVAVALVVDCIACSGAANPAPGTGGTSSVQVEPERPAWFRSAIDESRRTLEDRCWELAPLPVIYTDNPEFVECQRQAVVTSSEARRTMYDEALEQCVTSSSTSQCCFSKTTDWLSQEAKQQTQCNRECASRVGRPSPPSDAPRSCHSVLVSPPRAARSRAHTDAVDAVLNRCIVTPAEVAACEELGSFAERVYCKGTCEQQSLRFGVDVDACVSRARQSGTISCTGGHPDFRSQCEQRCRGLYGDGSPPQ